jgi:hypothetical protein
MSRYLDCFAALAMTMQMNVNSSDPCPYSPFNLWAIIQFWGSGGYIGDRKRLQSGIFPSKAAK